MRNYKSILTAFLIVLVYAYSAFQYKPYNVLYEATGGDAMGYYIYLPSFFIHHDLKDFRNTMLAKYKECNPKEIKNGVAPSLGAEVLKAPTGNPVIKYPMGVAAMQSPFFFIAHFLAGILHQPQEGFSKIYMYALQLSLFVYTLLAFLILILILRDRFPDPVIALVLGAIGFATNLYYLESINAPMSHPYLFFQHTLLIYATIRYYSSYRFRFLILIAICLGMITLTRANEISAVIIPLLWGIRNIGDAKKRINLIIGRIPSFVAAGLVFLLCVAPQMIYWRVMTGHFLYYSYGDEKFNFKHPHLYEGLFSCANGWLAYSPVMYLALIGIVLVYRRRHDSFLPIAVFLPLHIYVIYSFWCFIYMGSYGSRPMTETYPLLSIPLAYTIDWFWQSWFKKALIMAIITFFSWLTIFQAYQSYINIFNSEISNWRFNLITLGKKKLSYEEAIVIDTKEFQPKNPMFVKPLFNQNFEDSTLPGSTTQFSISGRRSVCVHATQSVEGCKMSLKDADAHPGQWIGVAANCYALTVPTDLYQPSQLVINFMVKGNSGKWEAIRLQNKIDNPDHTIWHFNTGVWGKAYFYSQIPEDIKQDDTINVFIWNGHPHGPDLYVDDFSAGLYNTK